MVMHHAEIMTEYFHLNVEHKYRSKYVTYKFIMQQ